MDGTDKLIDVHARSSSSLGPSLGYVLCFCERVRMGSLGGPAEAGRTQIWKGGCAGRPAAVMPNMKLLSASTCSGFPDSGAGAQFDAIDGDQRHGKFSNRCAFTNQAPK